MMVMNYVLYLELYAERAIRNKTLLHKYNYNNNGKCIENRIK